MSMCACRFDAFTISVSRFAVAPGFPERVAQPAPGIALIRGHAEILLQLLHHSIPHLQFLVLGSQARMSARVVRVLLEHLPERVDSWIVAHADLRIPFA